MSDEKEDKIPIPGSKPPPAKSPLAIYRLLAPCASVRVSPICLGAMNFGTSWEAALGKCDKETAFKMLDFFYEKGGNFIDTANNYQAGESEIWLGEWMKERQNRDDLVIATKFTSPYKHHEGVKVNYIGNSVKSLHLSVRDSLKKLQTDYIDVLYVHWWDFTTSVYELMNALDNIVKSGKVLYLGVSDTPAWVVSKANEYARNHGKTPFVVYQGNWSAAKRDMERDILPMCHDEGMGVAPWGALGGGTFKLEETKEGRQMGRPNHSEMAKVLDKIAKQKGDYHLTGIALAYVMHKAPNVYPICGGRSVKHLEDNIKALEIRLSDEEIAEIEAVESFDMGFPMTFLSGGTKPFRGPASSGFLASNAEYSFVEHPKPNLPRSG